MRIALTSSFFRPKTSGSASFSAGLAAELTSLGHEVLVFTCTPGDGGDAELPYRVVRLPAVNVNLGRFSYGYEIPFCTGRGVRTLWRELRAFRPDVLHLNEQFFDLSVWAGLWGRRHGVPRVMTLHTAFTHNVRWIHAVLRAVDATVVSFCLLLCDPTLVVIDKFMSRYAARRFPRRRREYVAIPVRSGVFDHGDPTQIATELGLAGRPVLLSLGHVIPLRDRLLLMRALPEVLAEVPDLAVVVVGRVYDDRFLHEAGALGVREAVVTTGEVPHERVKDFVAAADLECHETQSYGLGTASLEVIGSGLPVVAVVDADNFPGFQLEDRRQLLLAQPDPESLAAGILDLLRDPDLRARVGEGGRELILDHFQIRRVAEDYVALFQRSSAS
jgi:glycosyltransferase involved in cell wall biosynthesis